MPWMSSSWTQLNRINGATPFHAVGWRSGQQADISGGGYEPDLSVSSASACRDRAAETSPLERAWRVTAAEQAHLGKPTLDHGCWRSETQATLAAEAPLDATPWLSHPRDMLAELRLQGRAPGYELEAEAVVDHGEPT